ncbi:MAG: hypothetical protein R3Y11_01570 [Pseudomonadota bacterium]
MTNSTTDKRIFCASFSVKVGTKRVRFELADAVLFGGEQGLFRVRIDRRWHDTQEGTPLFLDRIGLANLLANAALGSLSQCSPRPNMEYATRVSIPIGYDEFGLIRREVTWTTSPPILASDGTWQIAVTRYGHGVVFMPCNEIIVKK